jgi:hypothetical protein
MDPLSEWLPEESKNIVVASNDLGMEKVFQKYSFTVSRTEEGTRAIWPEEMEDSINNIFNSFK